jgi:NADP-dependent 3-hydroxy acid dehydrogenase YdfG
MNKTGNVLITGATSGFGEAMARQFAAGGWSVTITGRRADRLENLKKDLESAGAKPVQTLCFDVRDRAAAESSLAAWTAENESLDILINNAGLAAGFGPLDEGQPDNWDRMIDTNVKGLLYVTRAMLGAIKKSSRGHIINIGSTASQLAYRNGNVYCATKAAVDMLSQSMRIDLLQYGIKVTAIHPGAAETEFSIVRFNGDEARAAQVYEGFQPLRAEDVAEVAWYAANVPAHVCLNEIVMTCVTQANGVYNIKTAELVSR